MANNQPLRLVPDIFWVGVNDTETPLFEGLWSIPEGVSYNSYLVKGSEKTALIDSVHEKKDAGEFVNVIDVLFFVIWKREQKMAAGL